MERIRLIQEDYITDRWKMLVSCILLNQTNNKQVRPILDKLFEYIPNYKIASESDPSVISSIIKPTGFQNVKADRIIKMSRAWSEDLKSIDGIPGLGKYAKETWSIFVLNDLTIKPTDKKLKLYLDSLV